MPLLFTESSQGGILHLDNFRHREWVPAIEAAGIERPARIYDIRYTFASNALAAGISLFELAKIMGTSVKMIERHYGVPARWLGGQHRRSPCGLRTFGYYFGRRARRMKPQKAAICRHLRL